MSNAPDWLVGATCVACQDFRAATSSWKRLGRANPHGLSPPKLLSATQPSGVLA